MHRPSFMYHALDCAAASSRQARPPFGLQPRAALAAPLRRISRVRSSDQHLRRGSKLASRLFGTESSVSAEPSIQKSLWIVHSLYNFSQTVPIESTCGHSKLAERICGNRTHSQATGSACRSVGAVACTPSLKPEAVSPWYSKNAVYPGVGLFRS